MRSIDYDQLPADPTEAANALCKDTLVDKMGIVFVEASPTRLVATMPVEGNIQPVGLLHGGAHCVLAETLGSVGAGYSAGPGRTAVGIEINATHHKPALKGLVTGTATRTSIGRTLATYEIVITDESDRRLSTSRLTCYLRDLPQQKADT